MLEYRAMMFQQTVCCFIFVILPVAKYIRRKDTLSGYFNSGL